MAEKSEVNSDLQHLNLLSVFHYILGGIMYLFGGIPILHLILGIVMLVVPMDNRKEAMPAMLMGCLFIFFSLAFMTMSWTLATLVIITGCKLAKKKSYLFCLVIAGIECIFMPVGTVLGVFTIIVLSRPSVKELFNMPQALKQKSGA